MDPPCCAVNQVETNPQTTDFDPSKTTENKSGTALAVNLRLFTEQANLQPNYVNKNGKPIFSSYRDYAMYLQAINRR